MHPTTELPARVADYPDGALGIARLAWPMRAAEELRSAMVFRAAAQAAHRIGEPHLAAALWSVARDELRHVRLCAAVGMKLGAPAPKYDLTTVYARLAALRSPRRRLLALLLVEAAIGETVSTALFRAGRRTTDESRSRAALTEILSDEVRHARLGWRALAILLPTLDAAERAFLELEARRSLAMLEQEVAVPALIRLEVNAAFDPMLARLGVLSPASRVEAFYQAIDRLVLPRLTALGIDGAVAWAERYDTNSSAKEETS